MNKDYRTTPSSRAAAQKYSDILHLTQPEPSYKHPWMSLQNRAKIFSPFAALRGYDEEIRAEQDIQQMVEWTELFEEDKNKISDKIQQIRKGTKITVCYFESVSTANDHTTGIYRTLTAAVINVDLVCQELRLYTGTINEFGKELPVVIPFDDILALAIPEPSLLEHTDQLPLCKRL